MQLQLFQSSSSKINETVSPTNVRAMLKPGFMDNATKMLPKLENVSYLWWILSATKIIHCVLCFHVLQDKYVYPTGAALSKVKMEVLEDIPDGPSHDREFVNKYFTAFFSNKYIKKLISKGLNRKHILDKLRSSKRHDTMKSTLRNNLANSLADA